MGDFSRDTFRLTNILHQVLTGQPVVDPRHYVGVRLQQGVPLLDSDWNELEDLRRLELQALVKMFIGTGVPAGDDGFRISSSGDANNVSIHAGVILVEGMLVINPGLTTYLAQPEQTGVTPLTTPGGILDRTDIVYLDVWHDEVAGVGGPDADIRLVNGLIGVETAVRIRRRWQVRTEEGMSDLSSVVPGTGHALLPLALLRRSPGALIVSDAMVVDQRVTGLTISNNLKSPLNVSRGAETVDCARFAQMAHNLRTILFQRLTSKQPSGQIPHQSASPTDESYLVVALQDLMNAARAAETQALSLNVSQRDALALMKDLYQSQQDWLASLAALGNVGTPPAAQSFIDDYKTYLDGKPGTLISGLKPALDASDVVGSVLAQEALNTHLASPVDALPEGTVIVAYKGVSPFAAMVAGTNFTFTFDVTAHFNSPLPSEVFLVDVNLPADFGTAVPTHIELTFIPGAPATQTVSITVSPSGVAAGGSFAVNAVAARSASVRSTQSPLPLTRGSTPPPPAPFFYAGTPLDLAGKLELSQIEVAGSGGSDIFFRLKNGSTIVSQTYQVTGQITITSGSSTGWKPQALPERSLGAGQEASIILHIDAPPAPPIGTAGTITATAVLTKVNGAPPAGAQTPIEIPLPFILV